ncbi:unnamed protein product [Symbiodinium microadriaticum]|nr:unnamed protein product [Symbiodinium microadriaticum]
MPRPAASPFFGSGPVATRCVSQQWRGEMTRASRPQQTSPSAWVPGSTFGRASPRRSHGGSALKPR